PWASLPPNEFRRDQLPLHAKPYAVWVVLAGNVVPVYLEARPIIDDEVVGVNGRVYRIIDLNAGEDHAPVRLIVNAGHLRSYGDNLSLIRSLFRVDEVTVLVSRKLQKLLLSSLSVLLHQDRYHGDS